MRKPMAKKVLAASLAAAMTMSFAACGEKTPSASDTTSTPDVTSQDVTSTSEDLQPYTEVTNTDGSKVDLGGIHIIVRDWFSTGGERGEAKSDYEQAQYDYQDWCQETYNFTLEYQTIGDWGSQMQDFLDYAETADQDENYYMFTLPTAFSSNLLAAADQGLVANLAEIDCIDFTKAEFANNAHKLYTNAKGVWGYRAGVAEPRTGMYFNKRILEEAGINPDDIYDMQKNGTWTWEAWEDILKVVQQDVDKDGTIDIWGITANEGAIIQPFVSTNGGKYVNLVNGKLEYTLESAESQEALEFIRHIINEYDWNGPEDAQWDYYKDHFKMGGAAFLPEDQYAGTDGNFLFDMEDELGFVVLPKGPKATSYAHLVNDNFFVLPAKYGTDKNWKIAFAFNVFNDLVPGWEDYNGYVNKTREGNFDERAWKETIPTMLNNCEINFGVCVKGMDLGSPFHYKFYPGMDEISTLLDSVHEMYSTAVADSN